MSPATKGHFEKHFEEALKERDRVSAEVFERMTARILRHLWQHGPDAPLPMSELIHAGFTREEITAHGDGACEEARRSYRYAQAH